MRCWFMHMLRDLLSSFLHGELPGPVVALMRCWLKRVRRATPRPALAAEFLIGGLRPAAEIDLRCLLWLMPKCNQSMLCRLCLRPLARTLLAPAAEIDLKALADAKMLKRMRILEEQVGQASKQGETGKGLQQQGKMGKVTPIGVD